MKNLNIKILIIGEEKWIKSFDKNILSNLSDAYEIESITDITYAKKRLTHNSYDILILHDKFAKNNDIILCKMAYAMTRPSLVICNNIFTYIKHKLWKLFSSFTNKFKISKKLIYFNLNGNNAVEKIEYLSKNHLQYTELVFKEIKQNTTLI